VAAPGDLKGTLAGGTTAIPVGGAMAATGSVAVAIGDLIVATFSEVGANSVTSCTDSLHTPTTYTAQNAGTLSTVGGRCFYFIATLAGTLTSVTGTGAAGTDDFAAAAAVFQGPFNTPVVDINATNVTDTTSPFSCPATGTLNQASELIIGWFALTRGQTITLATAPFLLAVNSASAAGNAASSCSSALGYQKVNATTTQTSVFTDASGTFNGGVLGTLTFKLGAQNTRAMTVRSTSVTQLAKTPTKNLSYAMAQTVSRIRQKLLTILFTN
jgi:hypothetical protein